VRAGAARPQRPVFGGSAFLLMIGVGDRSAPGRRAVEHCCMAQLRYDLKVPAEDYGIDVMMGLVGEAMDTIARSEATTLNGLRQELDGVLDDPRHDRIKSGAAMLRLRMLQCAEGRQAIADVRDAMMTSCQKYLTAANRANDSVVNYVLPFIRDTSVVIVHGCGPVLAHCIASSIELRMGVRFYVAEGLPQGTGQELITRVRKQPSLGKLEQKLGTQEFDVLFSRSVATVPDSSIASLMSDADLVLSGANTVTEHGGLAHTTGSLQIALIADAMRVPFYVLCEAFKFSAIFPLSTADLYVDSMPGKRGIRSALSASTLPEPDTPDPISSSASSPTRQGAARAAMSPGGGFSNAGSLSSLDIAGSAVARAPFFVFPVELVPPKYISLIFSEEGIMPPSAVADQMLIARRAQSDDKTSRF
jgi:translation initiation factor eIF-2B subunit alpha